MKSLLTTLAFIIFNFVNSSLFAQDSLVFYKDIQFTSDFEREAFRNFFKNNDKSQYLPLFISVSTAASKEENSNIRNRIGGINNLLISSGIGKKKPEKKIKAVYEQVHSTMLKKYEMESRFYQIFVDGNYNCVTATALYSLVFEALNIPYEIKEEPTHVYLLAYPNSSNILVETTTPMFGFINFDAHFKEAFVTNLKNQKVIGISEIEKKSTEELFNTYYFKNEKIDLKKLVGIHYMNDALFKNDHQLLKEAYEQAQKAYLFYPSARCEYLLMNFGVGLVNQQKLPAKEKSRLIAQISRLKGHGVTNDMIKGEFSNLTQDILFRDNNKSLYKECFEIIKSGTTDPELVNELSYIYFYENGRVYYNQGNYTRAKGFFQNALGVQPNNVDLGGIFVSVIAQNFRNEKDNKMILDSLTSYQTKFPSLKEHNNFNSMVAMAHIIQFGQEYNKGNITAGDTYKASFEIMLKENKNLNISSSVIGNAYSAACSYFFKRGQKAKAKEILAKGLELAPDSYELRIRQQMIH